MSQSVRQSVLSPGQTAPDTVVDDSLPHVALMNYHAPRGQTEKTLIDSHEKFEYVQIR